MTMPPDQSVALESPLRYPGGKRFLCPYIERILIHNDFVPKLLVEPFAGGASVALHLLGRGLVEKIALYDMDPLVAGLWWTVFNDGDWLKRKVRYARITVSVWEKLREMPLNGHRSNAWKCLFLNRTSFSGILSRRAGPIGGKRQQSDFKIGCRFYRKTIMARLSDLAAKKAAVRSVGVSDWEATLDEYTSESESGADACLLYLDPPFYHKADRLYGHCFTTDQHKKLVKRLSELKTPWILSYDDCPEVVALFKEHGLTYRRVPVQYTSSAGSRRVSKKELVASNLSLPRNRTS